MIDYLLVFVFLLLLASDAGMLDVHTCMFVYVLLLLSLLVGDAGTLLDVHTCTCMCVCYRCTGHNICYNMYICYAQSHDMSVSVSIQLCLSLCLWYCL